MERNNGMDRGSLFYKVAEDYEQRARSKDPSWLLSYKNLNLQYQRFEFVVSTIDFTGKRILDICCGYGDFKGFLDKKQIKYASYTGVDGSKTIMDRGRQKYKGIDLYHIIWPYIGEKELKELSDKDCDICIMLGVASEFCGAGVKLWFGMALDLVKEKLMFDLSQGRQNELCKSAILCFPGWAGRIIDSTLGCEWVLLERKSD